MGAAEVAPEIRGATMRQVRKTALVLCLGALALSVLRIPVWADEPTATEEAAAEAATIGVVETLAVVEAPAAQEIDAAEPETTTAILHASFVRSTSIDLDGLVIPGPILDAIAGLIPEIRILLSPDEAIIGIASFYDEPQETASGEPFNPDAFTAAAQLEIRDKFGGIRFGTKYQPAYGVAEYNGKKIILKFNDVGPLRPGRKFDLSRAAMAYFDGLEKGLLPDFKVTPLPLGENFTPGPVTDAQLATLGIGSLHSGVAMAHAAVMSEPAAVDAPTSLPDEASVSARLYATDSASRKQES